MKGCIREFDIDDINCKNTLSMDLASLDEVNIASVVEAVKKNFTASTREEIEDLIEFIEEDYSDEFESSSWKEDLEQELLNLEESSVDEEEPLSNVGNTEEKKTELKEFLTTIFRGNLEYVTIRNSQFKRNISSRTILNLDDSNIKLENRIVKSTEDINLAISGFIASEFNKIVKYLQSTDSSIASKGYYVNSSTGNVSQVAGLYLAKFSEILESTEDLRSVISQQWDNKILEKLKDTLFLDALDAYINIVYLDDLIKLENTSLVIDGSLSNPIVVIDLIPQYKYSLKEQNNTLAHNWWDADKARDAAKETNPIIGEFLNLIPIIDLTDTPTNQYITINSFTGAFSNLKILASLLGEGNKLKEIMEFWNNDPLGSLIKLSDYFKEKSVYESLLNKDILSLMDVNVIRSFIKTVCKSNKSIISIEDAYKIAYNETSTPYKIVLSLASLIGQFAVMNYMQTSYNEDSGKYETSIKEKHSISGDFWNMKLNLNRAPITISTNDRTTLLKKYIFGIPNLKSTSVESYAISIGDNILLTISRDNPKLYRIFLDDSGFKLTITKNSKPLSLSALFENAKLNTPEGRDTFLKTSSDLKTLLRFLDDILKTGFLNSTDSLREIYLLNELNKNSIIGMISTAFRTIAIHDLLDSEWQNSGKTVDNRDISELSKGGKLLWRNITLGEFDTKYLNTDIVGTYYIPIIKNNTTWATKLNIIRGLLSGDISQSVTKNLSGDSIPNTSPMFLSAKFLLRSKEFYKSALTNNGFNSPASKLFFSRKYANSDSITMVIDTDVRFNNGEVKKATELSDSEVNIHAIVDKFIGDGSFDKIILLPTVYSDKTKLVNCFIDLNKIKANDGFDFKIASETEIETAILETVGQFYKEISENVRKKFTIIFTDYLEGNPLLTESLINEELKKYDKYTLFRLALSKGLLLEENADFSVVDENILQLNPILLYYCNTVYANRASLHNYLLKLKEEFVKELMKTDTYFNIETFPSLISFMKNNSPSLWTSNEKYILAKAITSKESREYTGELRSGETIKLNPFLEKYFMANALFGLNIRLALSGSEIGHEDKKLRRFNGLNIILGLDGATNKYYTVLETSDFINSISDPLLKKLYLDKLTLFLDSTASRMQLAQLKRTINAVATVRTFTLNTFDGIGRTIKTATIDDVKAFCHIFNGSKCDLEKGIGAKEDAHDGSALIAGVLGILLNNSLEHDSVGTLIKPILDSFNETSGTATLFKYAANTMTNTFCRRSALSAIESERLLKKMYNLLWQGDITLDDFKRDADNEEDIDGKIIQHGSLSKLLMTGEAGLELSDLVNGGVYYLKGNTIYSILGFGVETVNGKDCFVTYELAMDRGSKNKIEKIHTVLHWFDDNGIDYGVYQEGLHSVNSIWELFSAFGGIYSMVYSKNGYIPGETSNIIIALFCNKINRIKEGKEVEVKNNLFSAKNPLTLEYFYLPLKDYFIGCVINTSAEKNGRKNINPFTSYYDDSPLLFDIIPTTHYGILLDSDHIADESLMTEFSLVISSLDTGGKRHNKIRDVYLMLGSIALNEASLELDAVNTYHTLNKDSKLYEIVGKTIIRNHKENSDSYGLSETVLDLIAKEFGKNSDHYKDAKKIPFSDPNYYSKILLSFISIINDKSVKKKYPGNGMVMAAGFDIALVFKIGDLSLLFDDVLELALKDSEIVNAVSIINDTSLYNRTLVNTYLEKLLNELAEIDIEDVYLEDVIHVKVNTVVGNIQRLVETDIDFRDAPDYYEFKDNPNEYITKILLSRNKILIGESVQTIILLLSVMKPRNLRCLRISWTMTDGISTKKMNIWDTPIQRKLFTDHVKLSREELQLHNKDLLVVFENLDKGFYEEITLDGSIKRWEIIDLLNIPAECIVSNQFLTKFGLSANLSLYSILNNPNIFNLTIKDLQKTTKYDMVFTRNNGKHTYITMLNVSNIPSNESFLAVKLDWKYITSENDEGFRKIYVLSKDNKKLFQIGREIDVTDKVTYDPDTNTYKEGNEILDSSLYRREEINGKLVIWKYIEFLSKYLITENGKKYTLYNLNPVKVREAFIQKIDSRELELRKADERALNPSLSEKEITRIATAKINSKSLYQFEASVLADIYRSDDYYGLTFNEHLSRKSLKGIYTMLPYLLRKLVYDADLYGYLGQMYKYIENNFYKTGDINKYPQFNIQKRDPSAYNLLTNNYLMAKARVRKSSFLKSLDFVSSRIPAQTTLSYMYMRAVGFTGLATNECYVSHYQTLLQGSDYDIDKAYMMAHSLSNYGAYVGWSNLFDYYSANTLYASERIPKSNEMYLTYVESTNDSKLSNLITAVTNSEDLIKDVTNTLELLKLERRVVANNLNLDKLERDLKLEEINLSLLLLELKLETSRVDRVNQYIDLLNYIHDNNITLLPCRKDILNKLIDHERYITKIIPDSLKGKAERNFVTANIELTVQDLKNTIDAYTPIDIDILGEAPYMKDSWNSSLFSSDTSSLNLVNPAAIYHMQREFMIGKKGIGIAANGEKGSFMAHYYTREKIRLANQLLINGASAEEVTKLYNMASINFKSTRIHNRASQKPSNNSGNFVVVSLPDIDVDVIMDELVKKVFEAGQLTGNLKVDLMISQVLSAATDNAKELILKKISCGDKLMKCYLFLITLGFNINDIVSFMTSPAVLTIDKMTEPNLYYDRSTSVEYAISLLLRKNEFSHEFYGSGYTDSDFKSDLLEFSRVWEGANEFTSLTSALKVNQGLPTDDAELIKFTNSFSTLLKSAEERFKKKYNITTQESFSDSFSMQKFLTDDLYRLDVIDFYEKSKIAFNPFACITEIDHFSSLYDLLNVEITVSKDLNAKGLAKWEICNAMTKQGIFLDEKFIKSIDSYITLCIINKFILSLSNSGRKLIFPKSPEWGVIDQYDKVIVDEGSTYIDLSTNLGLKQFKYIFENYVIPKLQNGYYPQLNSEGNITFIKDSSLTTNRFILDLIIVEDRQIPKSRLKIDTFKKNRTASDSKVRTQYINGIYDLSMKLIKDENGLEIGYSLADWFYIYNLIVNKNSPQRNSLTRILEPYSRSSDSIAALYNDWVGELDYRVHHELNFNVLDELLFSEKDFLVSTARKVYSIRGHNEPMIYTLKDGEPPIYWERTGPYQYKMTEISTVLPINNEDFNNTRLRMLMAKQYAIGGNTFSNYVDTMLTCLEDPQRYANNVSLFFSQLMRNQNIYIEKYCE